MTHGDLSVPFGEPSGVVHDTFYRAATYLGDMTLADRIEAYNEALAEWLRGLYHGMISHPAYEKIEKEAEDTEDAFLLACFPDAFGIPSPVSYYTAELLPYLEDEFEAWERRLWDRDTMLERKGQQYHF
jgi:hypothetical protein